MITLLPPSERPRERLQQHGDEPLSSAELIAIILGSGLKGKSVLTLSQELLAAFGGVDGLSKASIEELSQVKGLGVTKALQLKAAFALHKRLKSPLRGSQAVVTVERAYALFAAELEGKQEEHFVVALLDAKARLIRTETVAIGSLTETLVHPREVFCPAVRHKAAAILVAHNHPSGDPTPSKADLLLTERLVEAGETMGIPLRDHLIIGRDRYVSLKAYGPLAHYWGGGAQVAGIGDKQSVNRFGC